MKDKTKAYQPIACSYYDQLEAFATRRTHCKFVYDVEGAQESSGGIIADIFASDGAEYLKLDNGALIRLDRLISINNIPVSNIC